MYAMLTHVSSKRINNVHFLNLFWELLSAYSFLKNATELLLRMANAVCDNWKNPSGIYSFRVFDKKSQEWPWALNLTWRTEIGVGCAKTKPECLRTAVRDRIVSCGSILAYYPCSTRQAFRPVGMVSIVPWRTWFTGFIKSASEWAIIFLVAKRTLARFYCPWNYQARKEKKSIDISY